MKVKCLKFYNEVTRQNEDSSLWLTKGKEYIVLEIEIYPGKDILYRLVGDNPDQSPALYDARQFEIISHKLPSNWIIYSLKNGILNIGPKLWQIANFWENCYDLDPQALKIYKSEAKIIYENEGDLFLPEGNGY